MKKNGNLTKFLLAICLISSIPFPVNAEEILENQLQEENLSNLTLEELLNIDVVTASKKAENINLAPSTIYVVTEKDIQSNGYYTLKDVLENVPGVTTIDLGFFLFGGQRGFVSNFSQTLLMINGREVQNLIAAETFISEQFATHNIKQVEVIQGPASALYGANALVGVINIITKDSSKDFNKIEVQAELGTNNRKAFSFVFGQNFGDLRVSGSGRLFKTNNWDFTNFVNDTKRFSEGTPDIGVGKSTPENRYLNAATSVPLSLRLDYKWFYAGMESFYNKAGKGLENVALDYNAQFDVRDFSMYYGGFNYDFDGFFNEKNNINIEYQHTNEKFWGTNYTFKQDIFDKMVKNGRDPNEIITQDEIYRNFSDVYSQENSSGSKRDRVNVQLNSNFADNNSAFLENLDITAGYTFDRLDLLGISLSGTDTFPYLDEKTSIDNSMRRPFYLMTKNSGYLQFKKPVLDNALNITLGGRLDHNSIYGLIPTFRSGIVYNPFKNTYIKALFGQAFREPNIFELGAHDSNIDSESRGAKDLKPTKINTYEIGLVQIINEYLQGNVTFYRNDINNFIEPISTYEFANSKETKTSMGLESQLFFRIGDMNFNNIDFGSLSGDVNYALTLPMWYDTVAGQKVPALGIYRNRVNFGINYDVIENLRLNTRINFYDKVQAFHGNKNIDEIITLDPFAKLNFTILLHDFYYNGVKISFEATVKNALNGEFYQPNIRRGGPKEFMQPGREFIGRLIFEF